MIPIKGTHEKVERGIKLILYCIIDYVVKCDGETTLGSIAGYTGLNNVGAEWTADALKLLINGDVLTMKGTNVYGDTATLTKILEQEKTPLPEKHGKQWSEHEYNILAELGLNGEKAIIIAKKMGRTEGSVQMAISKVRNSYNMIPMFERSANLREYGSMQNSPNPEV